MINLLLAKSQNDKDGKRSCLSKRSKIIGKKRPHSNALLLRLQKAFSEHLMEEFDYDFESILPQITSWKETHVQTLFEREDLLREDDGDMERAQTDKETTTTFTVEFIFNS